MPLVWRAGLWRSSSKQPFVARRLAHCRARGDALVERLQRRPGRQVETHHRRPVGDRKKIAVSDRKTFADEAFAPFKLRGDVAEAFGEHGTGGRLDVVADRRIEQGAEMFVQLGSDEVEPLDRLVVLNGAGASCLLGAWSAMYWTMSGPSVNTEPSSSSSAGTYPLGLMAA